MDAQKLIAEKLIQCFNVFCVKFREKCYEVIEKNPENATKAKADMVLYNLYLLRMLIDISFKQHMMKRLLKALNSKISAKNIEKLLVAIIDELEQPTNQYFNVFNGEHGTQLQLNLTPIMNHLKYLEKASEISIEEQFSTLRMQDIEFLESLMPQVQEGTTLRRALEDSIIESKTNVFYSRYFKEGEVRNFILQNINRYIELALQYPRGNYLPRLNAQFPFLQLIPEFYNSQVKINQYLYSALNSLIELPEGTEPSAFSSLCVHIGTILMALLFNELSLKEKVDMLNGVFEYSLNTKDVKMLEENIEKYQNNSFVLINIKKKFPEVKSISGRGSLHFLAKQLFEMDLHQFSLKIYDYLYKNEQDIKQKTIILDNIATAKRDLGEFSEAIKIYEEIIIYYEKHNLHYPRFLAKKNVAYCYFKLGDHEKFNQIYSELESDLSKYTKEELINVYVNLAYRYKKTFQFEKEEHYLNLISNSIEYDDPRYFEVQERLNELDQAFDLDACKLDEDYLIKLEKKKNLNLNKRKGIFHQNHLNLNIFEYYIERAYEEVEFDVDYWILKSINCVLRKDWDQLRETSDEIVRLKPHNLVGHFFKSLIFLNEKNDDKLLYHLKQIYKKGFNNRYSVEAIEKLSNFVFFFHQTYDKNEKTQFFESLFANLPTSTLKEHHGAQIVLFFAKIYGDNNEEELSGYIFRRLMELKPSVESYLLYAGWCYRFDKMEEAKEYYKKVLSFSPNNIGVLERLARACLKSGEFGKSLKNVEKILELVSGFAEEKFREFKKYVTLLRDNKIRYEGLPFNDVRIVFNTVMRQLADLNPTNEIEFGNVLTEISKGIELLLGHILGAKILEFVRKKYPNIPLKCRKGVEGKIRPINRLFLNFLDDPDNNFPTLGNWFYLAKGIVEKLNPQNPVMQEIYEYLEKDVAVDQSKLKHILELKDVFLEERNIGTHRRLYSKEEVEKIIQTLTPIANDLIEYLPILI